jgi:hypothetical protein
LRGVQVGLGSLLVDVLTNGRDVIVPTLLHAIPLLGDSTIRLYATGNCYGVVERRFS